MATIIRTSQAGVYTEVKTVRIRSSQTGIYAEVITKRLRTSQVGVYVEISHELPKHGPPIQVI